MNSVQKIARGYTRVSTVMQSEDGVSLETQKTRIQAYCTYQNLNLIEIYIDAGVSGKDTENREELQRLLKDVKTGEIVIITDISRLSRNTTQALIILDNFKAKNISLISLDLNLDFNSPVGTLVFTMLASVAKMERENISRNVRINMQRLSKEGKLRSKPPFGYKFIAKDLDFEIVPEQQKVIEKIIHLFQENPCLAKIARKLNEDGDNKVIGLNRRDKEKEYKFTPSIINLILVDYGVLLPSAKMQGRKSIEERIKSHN
jgi:site-specific DNA recombinase